MKKTLIITFILGAVTGSGVTAYLSHDPARVVSDEEKEVIKSLGQSLKRETIDGSVLEIPDDSVNSDSRNNDPDELYGHQDGEEKNSSQMDKFERSLASEGDNSPPQEEVPATAPEEAPSENLYPEENNEEDPK